MPHFSIIAKLFLPGKSLIEFYGIDCIGGAIEFALDDENWRQLELVPAFFRNQFHHLLHFHQSLYKDFFVIDQWIFV